MTQTAEHKTDVSSGAGTFRRLPPWFRQEIPSVTHIRNLKNLFRTGNLHTVCESAHCPNMGQCWSRGVASLMLLGDICTRACRFCAVKAGQPLAVDPDEPRQVALAVKEMALRYVVITSVARDDLADEGSGHFAATVLAIKEQTPSTKVEILIPDFSAKEENLRKVTDARPEVISHNLETVRRLSPGVRPQAGYDRSLRVLKEIKRLQPAIFTKSSIMVGLGERPEEVREAMSDLAQIGCDILTVGQYLAPSQAKRYLPVTGFVTPETFKQYETWGYELRFKHVMSAPLVRSSYIAEEGYQGCLAALGIK